MSNIIKTTMLRKNLWYRIIVALIASVLLGYLWYDYRFPSWKEKVTLPDGRTIIIKERRDFIEGYGTRKTWLTFSLPEMGGEQTWEQWLYPTMIGAANGKVYVVGRPRGDKQFLMYSYPKYTYVAFQWHAGKFVRIPFLSVPESLRKIENIRWCFPGGNDTKNLSNSNDWCQWIPPVDGIGNYFSRPQQVDLAVRQREADFWAHLSGNRPASD